jgi:hypothetical protein
MASKNGSISESTTSIQNDESVALTDDFWNRSHDLLFPSHSMDSGVQLMANDDDPRQRIKNGQLSGQISYDAEGACHLW